MFTYLANADQTCQAADSGFRKNSDKNMGGTFFCIRVGNREVNQHSNRISSASLRRPSFSAADRWQIGNAAVPVERCRPVASDEHSAAVANSLHQPAALLFAFALHRVRPAG